MFYIIFFYYINPSKKIFPEDFFDLPNNTKDISSNLKNNTQRKNSSVTEHPKLLNPLIPKNKKQIMDINSIKEENGEESITYRECTEKNNNYENQFKNNQIRNNNSNEEGEHSTSGSSKNQISNNSTPEVCKIFNKNDNTPIENDDLFKITPHFINENNISNKNNIQLDYANNNNNNKQVNFERPLSPNLNLIKKSSKPISEGKEKILFSKINNEYENFVYECEKNQNEKNEIKKNSIKQAIKTDSNIKRSSFSSSKRKINNNCNNLQIDSITENNYLTNNENNNNYINNKSNKKNYNSINNPNSINKIPFPFNNNINMQSKNKINNKDSAYLQKQKAQRKNSTKISRRNSNTNMNKSIGKNKQNRNFSRKKVNEVIDNNRLKPLKSENRIKIVHSKVNNEINNLFSGLSDNIVKDPEIHNKIESLIKDIKDIQQVVNRKTQTHFRPRRQNSKNKKEEENYT